MSRAGLSAREAAERLARDGPNLLPGSRPKSALAIVREVATEPMFLMLLAAGGLYLALGDRAEAVFLLGFVFVVLGITLAQQRRTQRALESLRDLSAPRALVLRDGREQRIAGRDVVRGDLLVLHEGDRVAADGRLLEGELEVDESLLTGESVPVAKTRGAGDAPAADGAGRVYASTVVTRGVAVVEVTATGARTEVGRIGADLAATVEPPSALQRDSRALVRWVGVAALALAALQVALSWWIGRSLPDSLLSGIALAMAILPEEIPVILTVFLALGAWRIARRRVLTRRVSAVEALGAITVLAVDKTGTLTMNRMAVAELAIAGGSFAAASEDALPEPFHRLVEFAMLATPGDPFDPMEKAIQAFGHGRLAGTEHVHDGSEPEVEYPLSAEILAMTRVFPAGAPGEHRLATKGAPEAVADLCHLDATRRDAIRAQVDAMAERGLRVLGVACGRWQGAERGEDGGGGLPGRGAQNGGGAQDGDAAARGPQAGAGRAGRWPATQHDFDFEFLGLVGLADPPRPEVPAALRECRRAGVRVVMMTGDHPTTARAIAREVGLSERPASITGAEVDALDDAALARRLREVDLCARLRPEHKLRLVRVLRGAGEVVAMTGDGVNDAPALKAADVGVAMGERGTDVAREAAALVLLDDSFARIVEAIRQGRRIYDNIRKATRFVFAVHVPIVALALVPTLLHWPVLLMPLHIVLLELVIDPACSIVFEAEPEEPDAMDRPPRPRSDSPFSPSQWLSGLLQGGGVAAVLLVAHGWLLAHDWSAPRVRTVELCTLVASVLLLVIANRAPRGASAPRSAGENPMLWRMAAGVGLLLVAVLGVPWLRDVLDVAAPGPAELAAIAAVVAGSGAWLALLRGWGRRRAVAGA